MRTLLWSCAGLLVGAVVGWFALKDAAWGDALSAIGGLDPRMIILAVGAVIFAGILEAIRWKFLLPQQKVSIRRLFLVRHTAQGLNNVSPVRVFGDLTQGAMLKFGDGVHVDKVVSSLVMARMFDALITVSLVGGGLVVLPQLAGFREIVMPVWALVVVSMIVVIWLAARPDLVARIPLPGFLSRVAHSMGAVMMNMSVVLGCALLTATAWMSIATAAWLVGLAADIHLPFWLMAVVIVGVSMFSGAIPAPPGALGVYEFGVMSTLGLFAVDPSQALAFALSVHVVLFAPPIIIGMVVLAFDRRTLKHTVGTSFGFVRRKAAGALPISSQPSS
jgi:uncharacterized membrane protein YbhN (UPF0104 family)